MLVYQRVMGKTMTDPFPDESLQPSEEIHHPFLSRELQPVHHLLHTSWVRLELGTVKPLLKRTHCIKELQLLDSPT